GAQPLAATMNGAAFLGIDVDPERIKKRLRSGYIDVMVNSLDEALRILKNAVRKGEATSVGLVGNCADLIPELARRGVVPDLLTDQTSAHDPIGGYVPNGMSLETALELRKRDRDEYRKRSLAAMAQHVQGMLDLQKLGSVTFDYGNNIRTFAYQQGVKNAYDFPGFVPEYIRPLFCEGKGPFRWAALSGEAPAIAATDKRVRGEGRAGAGDGSGERTFAPLDHAGAKARAFPGIAGANLLARIRRARQIRLSAERIGGKRRSESACRDGPRPSRLRLSRVAIS